MISSLAHLRTRRPSPTTVEFTVSDLTPRSSFSRNLLFGLVLLLRLLVGTAVLAVNLAKWDLSSATTSPIPVDALIGSALGWSAQRLAQRVDWWMLLLVSAALGFAVVHRGYTEESLLVLRGLGIQTSTTASTYLSTSSTRFIPTNLIQDMFIHEAFRGFEVRFYLTAVVQDEKEVVVVFPNLLPGRLILEQVWRGARECLYEPKG
ncbi:MAG: hypothetical protein M4579_004050 [Chaenotheca gracillima]|nr:MAG: hypothetical protein M4579_004050 [Chaenotheca gracillima]